MSNSEIDISTVVIAGREFKIKCPKDARLELQKAVKYLNGKISELQSVDRFVTIDRVTIIAALNIAHELILEKQQMQISTSEMRIVEESFAYLQQKLDKVFEVNS